MDVKWRKNILFTLIAGPLIAIATLIFCVLTIEGVLRIFHVVPESDYRPIYDMKEPYHLRPGSSTIEKQPEFTTEIRTNSEGFRDSEFDVSRNQGVERIAVVGDSFAFGTGVRMGGRFSEYLEKELNAEGIKTEVFNFGLPASDTEDQVEVLKRYVLKYKPDVVLLVFYVGNDITDNAAESMLAKKPAVKTRTIKNRLWTAVYRSRIYKLTMSRVAASPVLGRRYNEFKTTRRLGEVGRQIVIFDRVAGASDAMWRKTRAALASFSRTASAAGAKTIVALAPTRLQYDDNLWKALVASQKLNEKNFSTDLPNEILGKYLGSDLHIAVIDPLRDFRDAEKKGAKLYYPINGHWTEEGHRLFSKKIALFLANTDKQNREGGQ
ncbi:MAG TPA: SGNH/GDSL hydrolase family protein [bacterium]|nr:SGNH/GDSL hydrolase family protein [bacterium]